MEEKESFKLRCKKLRISAYMTKNIINAEENKRICNFTMSMADIILKYKISEKEFKCITNIILNEE